MKTEKVYLRENVCPSKSGEIEKWIYSPLGNIQGMFWSLEGNCGRWSHSPQWFCTSLILHWDLSCFTSRQVKSRLNLEREGAREGPCTVAVSVGTSQERSVYGQGCRGGQEKEALGWRLRVKGTFEAVKFRIWSEKAAKFRLWSEKAACSLSVPGSAGQDAALDQLYYRDKDNSFLARSEGAIPEVSLPRSSSHTSEQSQLLLRKARSLSPVPSPLHAQWSGSVPFTCPGFQLALPPHQAVNRGLHRSACAALLPGSLPWLFWDILRKVWHGCTISGLWQTWVKGGLSKSPLCEYHSLYNHFN